MMQRWDFVDPKLASKLQSIHKDIEELTEKRKTILNNPRINNSSKQKLLDYNDKCIQDLLAISKDMKYSMTDYLDCQVQVLTKKEVHPCLSPDSAKQQAQLENTRFQSIINSKQLSTDLMLNLSGESPCRDSISSGKHEPRIGNPNDFKLEYLDSTGRFTSKTHIPGRDKNISNFSLASTSRNYRLTNSDEGYIKNNKNAKQIGQSVRGNKKRKAKISHRRFQRIKKQLVQKQLQVQLQRIFHQNTSQQLEELRKEKQEDKQLIQLLYTKISLIEANRNKQIQDQRNKLQTRYDLELQDLRKKYLDLSTLQEKNRELVLKRKEMLKMAQQ